MIGLGKVMVKRKTTKRVLKGVKLTQGAMWCIFQTSRLETLPKAWKLFPIHNSSPSKWHGPWSLDPRKHNFQSLFWQPSQYKSCIWFWWTLTTSKQDLVSNLTFIVSFSYSHPSSHCMVHRQAITLIEIELQTKVKNSLCCESIFPLSCS